MNAIEEESSVEKNIKERKELWKEYFPVGRKIAVWVIFFYVILGCLPHYLKMGWMIDDAGTFGDSFGFVNAFFSGFAVAGLLVTIWIQIREFRHAQQERRDALDTQKEIGLQHAKNLEVQKQIADSYTKNIEIQKQISDQAYLSSVASSIATWNQLHSNIKIPPIHEMNEGHLEYLRDKRVNLQILQNVNRVNRAYASEGRLDLTLLQENDSSIDLDATTRAAVGVAGVVMKMLTHEVDIMLRDEWTNLAGHIRDACSVCKKWVSTVVDEAASSARSEFVKRTITSLEANALGSLDHLSNSIEEVVDNNFHNGELNSQVRKAVMDVQNNVVRSAIYLLESYQDVVT